MKFFKIKTILLLAILSYSNIKLSAEESMSDLIRKALPSDIEPIALDDLPSEGQSRVFIILTKDLPNHHIEMIIANKQHFTVLNRWDSPRPNEEENLDKLELDLTFRVLRGIAYYSFDVNHSLEELMEMYKEVHPKTFNNLEILSNNCADEVQNFMSILFGEDFNEFTPSWSLNYALGLGPLHIALPNIYGLPTLPDGVFKKVYEFISTQLDYQIQSSRNLSASTEKLSLWWNFTSNREKVCTGSSYGSETINGISRSHLDLCFK